MLQCFFAAVVYTQIVVRRREQETSSSSSSAHSLLSIYLLGWGIIIPLALYLPYEILELLDVQNKAVKLSLSTLPTVVAFRTIEAMYGTSPPVVESSLGTYIAYYSSLMHCEWDLKTLQRRRITSSELLETFGRIAFHFHLISVLLSVAMHFEYQPFPSKVPLDSFFVSWDLFAPSHLLNCYLLALVTFYMLSTAFELTAVSDNARGFYTKSIFHNPLWTSRSPSEFWGARWNLMIHRILKHGVYLPVRRFFPTRMAVVATFVASGLLHDYCWSVIFYHHRSGACASTANSDTPNGCWSPILLKPTAFFAWNGIVLLMERPIRPHCPHWMTSLPTPIVSTVLLLTALPVSHWFTGDWAAGGMYSDFALATWHVRQTGAVVVHAFSA